MAIDQPISRRQALAAGAAGVGAVVLGACGSNSENDTRGAQPATSPSTAATSAGPSGGPLAKLSDVPVGGAISVQGPTGEPVIIAQPTAGEAVAFSGVCTHMQCSVAPSGNQLKCPCHGSTFDVATGKPTKGPAVRPLPKVEVHVAGDQVIAG